MKRLVVTKASREKWVWLLLQPNGFDAGHRGRFDLGAMNYGVGHLSGMCFMWLWVQRLWPCLDDWCAASDPLGTGGVSSFTIALHHEGAFKQPVGAPTASLPRALWCLYGGEGHCVGRSVTEARGQGSVVVLAAEQEVSAATSLRYASYTSTCQFILWTDSTKAVSITRKSHNVSGFCIKKVKKKWASTWTCFISTAQTSSHSTLHIILHKRPVANTQLPSTKLIVDIRWADHFMFD